MPPERPDGVPPPSGDMEEIHRRVQAIGQENERILRDLIAGESRFRRLAKAVWQVQEDERRRLARELHDGIGQTLTALKNHLEWLQRQPAGGGAGSELAEAVGLAAQALEDTRELSRLLRPPVLDDLGLSAALSWLARVVGKRSELEIAVDADDPARRLPTEIETVLFRVAQEALTNTVKHARARTASVRLRDRGSEVELTVADDGRGFEPPPASRSSDSTGVGLRGMHDRVELFAGRLDVDSEPGHGTRIVARLPLPAGDGA